MDRVVRHAIDCGPEAARRRSRWRRSTPRTHFGLERELGSIAPGRRADCILTSDLRGAADRDGDRARRGGGRGRQAAWRRHPGLRLSGERAEHGAARPAARGRRTSTSPRRRAPTEVRARVIGVVENQAPTRALEADLAGRGRAGRDGPRAATSARSRWSSGIAAPAASSTASSRASATTCDCAVASTVAHDSHHMIVVGTNKADMALAANRLGEVGGGVVVWREGRELALVRAADRRADVGRARRRSSRRRPRRMVAAMRGCGCTPQQRLHAALAAGAGGHPGAAHLRSRADRRDALRARPSCLLPA